MDETIKAGSADRKKEQRTGSYGVLTLRGLAKDSEHTKEPEREAKGGGGSHVKKKVP